MIVYLAQALAVAKRELFLKRAGKNIETVENWGPTPRKNPRYGGVTREGKLL